MVAKITRRIPYTAVVISVYDTALKDETTYNKKIPYYAPDSKEFRKYIKRCLAEYEHLLSYDIVGHGEYAVSMPVDDFVDNGNVLEDKEYEAD